RPDGLRAPGGAGTRIGGARRPAGVRQPARPGETRHRARPAAPARGRRGGLPQRGRRGGGGRRPGCRRPKGSVLNMDWAYPAPAWTRRERAASPRHFSAIRHADLSGFVRLTEGEEVATFEHLRAARREVWRPAIDASGGRLVHGNGDSMLIEYGSALAAVLAA